MPDRFVAKSGARNRVGKIFIDYLRNGRGSTTGHRLVRACPRRIGNLGAAALGGAGTVKAADQWTIANAARRFKTGNAPWDAYEKSRATLDRASDKLQPSARKR